MRKDPTAFRERFKKWKETGEYELPRFAMGTEGDDIEELIRKRLEQRSDNTSVQRYKSVLPIKRQYGKVVDPKLVERLLQRLPVIKQGKSYTERRVDEENNKRTWRSEVADQLHGAGEGALFASNFIPFSGELFSGGRSIINNLRSYLLHPNYKTVYHGSPYPFDIKNAASITPEQWTAAEDVAENTRRFKLFADQHRSKIKHVFPHRLYNKFVELFGDKLDMSLITVDDVYSAMRGRQRVLRSLTEPHAQYSETGGSFYDEAVRYFNNQELLGELDLLDNGSVGMIESYKPGNGRMLYDAAIEAANLTGRNGIISGEHLISSPKTFSTWKHYPNKQLVGNYGRWGNKMMKPANKRVDVNTVDEAMNADASDLEFSLNNAPVYRLTLPSQYVPVKDTHYFNPEILDAIGNMHVDLSNPSIYRTLIPVGIGYGLYNSQQQ